MSIETLFASVPGLKADYKVDWKEDAKVDWKVDWAAAPPPPPPLTAPVNTVAPTISGTPEVAQTLTLSAGTWTGNPVPTLTYQWNVDGSPVAGQTSLTYVVDLADVGFNVTCSVTATNSQGVVTVTTAAVGPVTA